VLLLTESPAGVSIGHAVGLYAGGRAVVEGNAADPSFAQLLRRYRRISGLTQEGLAEQAGLSTRAVSDLERDDSRVPRRDTLDLLLGALALSTEDRAIIEGSVARAR